MSETHDAPPQWMLSFADLLSLILTFFVLIFSMAKPYHQVSDYKKTELAPFSFTTPNKVTNVKLATTDQDLSINYLTDIIKDKFALYPELQRISLQNRRGGLALSIPNEFFNDKVANKMARVLKGLDNRVELVSGNLESSYKAVQKLQANGVGKNIDFFETHRDNGRIDIVIYP